MGADGHGRALALCHVPEAPQLREAIRIVEIAELTEHLHPGGLLRRGRAADQRGVSSRTSRLTRAHAGPTRTEHHCPAGTWSPGLIVARLVEWTEEHFLDDTVSAVRAIRTDAPPEHADLLAGRSSPYCAS